MYCNVIVMFMFVNPVSGLLRPVCDFKLIRCVDLHTRSRFMVAKICNLYCFLGSNIFFVVFITQLLVQFVYVYMQH